MRFGVWSSEFRVYGLGLRVWGLEFGVKGLGFTADLRPPMSRGGTPAPGTGLLLIHLTFRIKPMFWYHSNQKRFRKKCISSQIHTIHDIFEDIPRP